MALLGRSQPFRPHLAPAIIGTPPVLPPVAPAVEITEQSRNRALLHRRLLRPHLPGPVVAAAAAAGAPLSTGTFVRTAINKRPLTRWQVHKPLLPPPPFSTGPLPVLGRIGRFNLQAFTALPPRRHLPPAIVGAPPPPNPPGVYHFQHLRRPLVGRTTPKPHLPTSKAQPPLRPGKIVSQCLRRPYVGRRGPAPHLPPSIIGTPAAPPAPVNPGTFVRQALRRRPPIFQPRPHLVGPLVGVRIAPTPGDFTVDADVNNSSRSWTATIGYYRWAATNGNYRWVDATATQSHWSTEINRP